MKGLHLKSFQKSLGDFSVVADFRVSPQERVALLGASGGGKTTLLRTIAGLESLDQGQIFLNEQSIETLPTEKREIGFIFQDQALFSMLTVLENAAFGLEMRGVAREERNRQALEWLGRVGLAERVRVSVSKLSGGERQRLALVRAFIWKPKLILMDEPFSALDPQLRQALRALVVQLHQQHPVPLLFVTHDEEEAAELGTDSIRLRVQKGADSSRSVRSFVREIS